GCHGGGNEITKTSLITHFRDRHYNGDAQAITRQSLSTNLAVFEEVAVTFKRMGIWLCGGCFKMHNLHSEFRYGKGFDFVSPPGCSDDVVSLFLKGLQTVKSIPPKCRLGFSQVLKEALDKVMRETLAESSSLLSDVDEEDIDLGERNIKQCKRKICDGHNTSAVRVLSSSGVAPYNDATLEDLKTKHPFKPHPSLPLISIDHHHLDGLCAQHLMDCLSRAVVAIYDELVSSIIQAVNLFLDGKCPNWLGEYIANALLTLLVKPGGGIRPIDVGTFSVGMAGGSEAIIHSVNRLIEAYGDDVGLSMLLVDFKKAFNLVDREVMLREGDPIGPLLFSLVLHPVICKIIDSFNLSLHAWYLDDGTIVGDIVVVGKVLELIMEDGPGCGLHFNVDKTKVFWPKEDPQSRIVVWIVMKRVAKTIGLLDDIAKINDPQCELLLLHSCVGISRLYFTMRTCPPRVFEYAQRSFDVALHSSLERIVTASRPGFGDWQ
ncbi:hypothetical protein Tco_1068246, partial [Tanacetum coccineum]